MKSIIYRILSPYYQDKTFFTYKINKIHSSPTHRNLSYKSKQNFKLFLNFRTDIRKYKEKTLLLERCGQGLKS